MGVFFIEEGGGLVSVRFKEGGGRGAGRASGEQRRRTALGMIQVELPKGQVRITGSIDAESLRVVIECLLR